MESKNPLVRLVTYGKYKRMMKQFIGQPVDNLERQMMRGIFTRKLKDFNEMLQEEHDSVPLVDRLRMNRFQEETEEPHAKKIFRSKVLGLASHSPVKKTFRESPIDIGITGEIPAGHGLRSSANSSAKEEWDRI